MLGVGVGLQHGEQVLAVLCLLRFLALSLPSCPGQGLSGSGALPGGIPLVELGGGSRRSVILVCDRGHVLLLGRSAVLPGF